MLNQDQKEREEKLEIFIPNGPRLGNKVIEAHGVSKAFGDKLLFDNLNFMLPPNGIVGVIGPNGAGKTTLFRLIQGMEKPDAGKFEVINYSYLKSRFQVKSSVLELETTIFQFRLRLKYQHEELIISVLICL
jgi:ATPase subunit of ABC transporter with duplicated ATPase domains